MYQFAGNTNLVGGIINSGSGELTLNTGSLTVSNLDDYRNNYSANVSLGFTLGFDKSKSILDNISGTKFDIGFSVLDQVQLSQATIGSGYD